MKNKAGKILVLLLTFCVTFSGLPFLSGNLDAHAASKKAAKKITLSAAASGQNRAVLKWNKIKKPQKGYAVFRDGQPIAHVGKKLSFSDSGLAAGSAHTYQIKVYKTKKVKVWFNKSTGKWQKKKPAKKSRGKSKKVTTYIYQKPSNAVNIRTAAAVSSGTSGVSASGSNQSSTALAAPTGLRVVYLGNKQMKITWNAVSGAEKYKLYRKVDNKKEQFGYSTTTTRIDTDVEVGSTYRYRVAAVRGNSMAAVSAQISVTVPADPVPTVPAVTGTRETKTVTNYRGTVTSIYKNSNESFWRLSSNNVKVSDIAAYDKTVDGDFTNYNGHSMRQYHGAAFDLTDIAKLNKEALDGYEIKMYNGDASKFIIDADATIEPVNTYYSESGAYGSEIKPITRYYYNKNGRRIAGANLDGTMYKTSFENNITTRTLKVDTWGSVGTGIGIYTDIINFTIKYDGKTITTLSIDTAKDRFDSGVAQNGMSGRRRIYLDIAQAAMNKYGCSGNLKTDLAKIDKYVQETYKYGEKVSNYGTSISMTCAGGAGVLETWSIYKYGEWGFVGPGSSSVDTHMAFRLNSAPSGGYYETQGGGNPDDYLIDEDGNSDYHYELNP